MNRLLRLFVWLSCVGILRTKMGLALWLNPVIRCTMRRRLLCGTFETLGLRCPNGASGPNRTFMTFAANGSLEPKVTDAAACTNGSNSTKADVKLVQTAKMQLRGTVRGKWLEDSKAVS